MFWQKHKKKIIIAIVVILLGVTIWAIVTKPWKTDDPFKSLDDEAKDKGLDKKTDAELLQEVEADNTSFPLKMGSTGLRVQQLQQYIINNGQTLPEYGVDGKWFAETEAAVVQGFGENEVTKEQFIENKMYLIVK